MWKIKINKSLIFLKLALLVWYGATGALNTFLFVFFKQKGLTLTELSIIYSIGPILQIIASAIFGIIVDKTGKLKPVLFANLWLMIMITVGMLLAPNMNENDCEPQQVDLKCHQGELGLSSSETSCNVINDVIELTSCNLTCSQNVTQYCNKQNLFCELQNKNEDCNNFSISVHVTWAYELRNENYYNVTSFSYNNKSLLMCNIPLRIYGKIQCLLDTKERNVGGNSVRKKALYFNISFLGSFLTIYSNIYRFLDVTAMFSVAEHNSDFGRQRFFGISGLIFFSLFAGYIVDATTKDGEDKNYDSVLYFFIVMILLLLAFVYKLDVKIRPPGKNMRRKSLCLLKKPDVITFCLVLLVLGTYNFKKVFLFWHLDGMNSPSFLLGLTNALNSLYGLPFLFTSNWWVKKVGASQIFLLGLLGYAAMGVGYSLIWNPWLSLLIEAYSIVSYHLLWVAVVLHSHTIAPEGLLATVIATAGTIHFGIGKAVGGFAGSLIMDTLGERTAFLLVALTCLATAVVYGIYLCLRKIFYSENMSTVQSGSKNAS